MVLSSWIFSVIDLLVELTSPRGEPRRMELSGSENNKSGDVANHCSLVTGDDDFTFFLVQVETKDLIIIIYIYIYIYYYYTYIMHILQL